MMFSPRHNIILAAMMLAACSHDPNAVPVTHMGTKGIGTVDVMTARAGDTPEALAAQTQLDIGALLAANGLDPHQQLKPGQKLTVPVPTEIVAIRGDTVDTIARAFGVTRDDVIRENSLEPPYYIGRGQVVRIPSRAQKKEPENKVTSWLNNVFGADDAPETAITKSGEAATPITTTETATGSKVHQSASGVIIEDDLAPPPAMEKPIEQPVVPASELSSEPPSEPVALAPAQPAVMPEPIAPPQPKPAPVSAGPVKLSWPVNGPVLSGYGTKSSGAKNEGINIGAPLGTPVRTAAAGEVVYVGDNVAGFGSLVLVRHEGGLATAYGHVQKPLVKRGDSVSAGQAIAQVGKTGNVATPQLHFQVRKGTNAVNPEGYLP